MRTLLAVVLTFLAFTIAEAGKYQFPANGQRVTVASGTFANSQVDTIIIIRDHNLAGLTLSIAPADSMQLHSTTAGKIGRWFDLAIMPYIGADTLSAFTNYTLPVWATADTAIAGIITLSGATQPLPDKFIVLITYASAGNGTTTPTVYYTVSKQYYR
jgi:hypothetical protein